MPPTSSETYSGGDRIQSPKRRGLKKSRIKFICIYPRCTMISSAQKQCVSAFPSEGGAELHAHAQTNYLNN
jgi:hypothetical protein